MVENTIKNITELIEYPEKTSNEDLNSLFKLSNQHSYSAVCFIIIAKILKAQKRTGFEKFLKSAALRSNNRKQLFKILNTKVVQVEIEDQKPISSIEKNTEIKKPKEEEEKFLEQTIFSNLISNELVNEINQENTEPQNKTSDPVQIDHNTEFTFERWLYKENTEITSKKERSVDDVLRSLENRKQKEEKNNFYSAEAKAKKSLEDKDEMNTETLAEIYVKQGNYPKAIKIYEQLMLSNPEKKLFFASRINYINNKTIL